MHPQYMRTWAPGNRSPFYRLRPNLWIFAILATCDPYSREASQSPFKRKCLSWNDMPGHARLRIGDRITDLKCSKEQHRPGIRANFNQIQMDIGQTTSWALPRGGRSDRRRSKLPPCSQTAGISCSIRPACTPQLNSNNSKIH